MDNDFIISEDILYKYVGNSKEVIIPEKIKIIYKEAFADNESIEKILMPDELEIIEDSAFARCVNLKSVMFNKQLKCIGEHAFIGCGKIYEIDLPDSISYMGEDCLFGTNITEIILPAGLIKIDFKYMYGLKKSRDFAENNPVTHIGVSQNSLYYIEVDNCIFSKNMKILYSMTIDTQEKIVIPEGIEVVEDYFLHICSDEHQINELILPHSLRFTHKYMFTKVPIKRIVIKNGCCPSYLIVSARFDEIIVPESVNKIEFWRFDCRGFNNKNIYLLNPETSIEISENEDKHGIIVPYMVYAPESEKIRKSLGNENYTVLSDEEITRLKKLTEE